MEATRDRSAGGSSAFGDVGVPADAGDAGEPLSCGVAAAGVDTGAGLVGAVSNTITVHNLHLSSNKDGTYLTWRRQKGL